MGCALGDTIHPREPGLFKAVELAVELHGAGGFTGPLVFLDFLGEPPVVGESCCTSVLTEVAALLVAGAEFGLVGPENDHVGGRGGGFGQRLFHSSEGGFLLSRWLFLILTPCITRSSSSTNLEDTLTNTNIGGKN